MPDLLHIEEPERRATQRPQPQLSAFLGMGFRPLYPAGTFWAAASIGIWIFAPRLASGTLAGPAWHAHEMLWGFVATMALALAVAAFLCGWQLLDWKPLAVRRRPILWILYVGHACLGVGLLLAALHSLGLVQRAAIHVHVLAIGGFSVLIVGMMTRTALGHLGRPLVLDRMSKACYA
ncbi:NnrS protein [Variovorax sp. PBL-E5]|nr:NnrS protein [Variovorax sp. PBL-E5]